MKSNRRSRQETPRETENETEKRKERGERVEMNVREGDMKYIHYSLY